MSGVTRRSFVQRAVGTAIAGSAIAPAVTAAQNRPKKTRLRRATPTWTVEDRHLIARNPRIEAVFDGETGGIRSLTNRVTGQALFAAPVAAPTPWRMTDQQETEEATLLPFSTGAFPLPGPPSGPPVGSETTFTPANFRFEVRADGLGAVLRWDTGVDGVRMEVSASLKPGGDLELRPRIVNDRKARPPKLLTYPILSGLQSFSTGGDDDFVIYPQSSAGFLYRQPFAKNIPHLSETYPDGYSGACMQAMGYFEQDKGGFYFAAHDPHATRKFLHFSQAEVSVKHESWDLRNGAGMELDYPVVIGSLWRGDWYAVAERYRAWGIKQSWCSAGPKAKRSDSQFARWLHEEVGLVVWAAPSAVDWSPWLKFFREAAGTPIHIIPAYDWSATRSWQKGFEGYFPAKFHPNNVAAYAGNRVTPYMNNLFISEQAEGFATDWEPAAMVPLHPPQQPYAFGPFAAAVRPDPDKTTGGYPDPAVLADVWWFLCPTTAVQKSLHTWRDRTLIEQTKFDGVQYDISFSNPENWMTCHRGEHGHPPGAGRWMIDHFIENARLSKEAMSKALGRYAVQGTETINETAIGVTDCFFSRVVAGPQAVLEGRNIVTGQPYELPPGQGIEVVPFFDAVYHDYGPVRQDGFAQLNPGYGEIFYWIASRQVVQFGGLLDLDYNVAWPEAIPGLGTDDPKPSYTPYDGGYYTTDTPPPLDTAKVAFLREIATARTGFGNRWLAYGRPVRPTGTSSPMVTFDFGNHRDQLPHFQVIAKGTWDVPQLLEAAWLDGDNALGLFFVNLSKDKPLRVDVDVDAKERWGLDLRRRFIEVVTSDGARQLARVGRDNHVRFSLDLPPRKIVLVTPVTPSSRKYKW